VARKQDQDCARGWTNGFWSVKIVGLSFKARRGVDVKARITEADVSDDDDPALTLEACDSTHVSVRPLPLPSYVFCMRQLFFYLTLTAEEAGAWKSGELVNDRDGDDILDEEDYCPDCPGNRETKGC